MKKNYLKNIIVFVLCAVVLAGAVSVPAFAEDTEPAEEESAISYEEINAKLTEIAMRREELSSTVGDLQEKIATLKGDQETILEQKVLLDERDSYITEQISLNNDMVDLYKEMIAEKSLEVDSAKAKEDEQLKRYRKRVRSMEENGSYDYLGLILQSSDLADLLTALDDIGEVMDSDKRLQKAYIEARKETEEVKAEYEQVKAECEARIQTLESEKSQLQEKMQEAYQLFAALAEDVELYHDQWVALVARQAAERAALQAMVAANNSNTSTGTASSTGVVGTGSLIWPVSSTRITSEFGLRNAPTAGASSDHQGIDIDAFADPNQAVSAADTGTVTYAGYSSGYGNYIVIDHGNGTSTLYAHLSSSNVSTGQTVSQGEQIGNTGHTGIATGDHLHFEVMQNGENVDPMSYFDSSTVEYYH